ncbi:hypothetical protein [Companilactobacillus versmoldensis]|uniref:hypothetical protein n=1 Tax=Companilactobacillus versmoldensis TaxID=194326 RepID=UPI0002492410|nr:hypothetical protein [Companilactobacillus versmoldensis]
MKSNTRRYYAWFSGIVILLITIFGRTPFINWMNDLGIYNEWLIFFCWLFIVVFMVTFSEVSWYRYQQHKKTR